METFYTILGVLCCLSVPLYFIAAFYNAWFGPKSPEEKIKELKNQAEANKINYKAVLIILRLGGKSGQYSDEVLKIESLKSNLDARHSDYVPIKITAKSTEWNVVYESTVEKSGYYKSGTHLEPRDDGGYNFVDDYKSSDCYLSIKSYIVGDWEKHFKTLYSHAEFRHKSNEGLNNKNTKQSVMEEEKKRFGL